MCCRKNALIFSNAQCTGSILLILRYTAVTVFYELNGERCTKLVRAMVELCVWCSQISEEEKKIKINRRIKNWWKRRKIQKLCNEFWLEKLLKFRWILFCLCIKKFTSQYELCYAVGWIRAHNYGLPEKLNNHQRKLFFCVCVSPFFL